VSDTAVQTVNPMAGQAGPNDANHLASRQTAALRHKQSLLSVPVSCHSSQAITEAFFHISENEWRALK
jgi:hypothetical protein